MKPNKVLGFLAILLLLAIGCGTGTVVWALRQVPDFYDEALREEPNPAVRREEAKQFVQRTLQLIEKVQQSESWSEEFTQQQVNSWLAEELHHKYAELVPEGARDPRVRFSPDAVQIGFRFQWDGWNSVVSLKVKLWVPEPNLLAIEFQSVKAGLVPIPLENILQEFTSHFETEGWHVEWRQSNGNDVIVLHLDPAEPAQLVLELVDVSDGAVKVSGSRRPEGTDPRFRITRLADQSAEK